MIRWECIACGADNELEYDDLIKHDHIIELRCWACTQNFLIKFNIRLSPFQEIKCE